MTPTPVPAPSLSERERAALQALAETGGPATGANLAALMRASGRERTSAAAAHQAANALDRKGLARKHPATAGTPVRYEITDAGRELAAAGLASLIRRCCQHCEHSPSEQPDPRTSAYRHDTACPHGCASNDQAGETL